MASIPITRLKFQQPPEGEMLSGINTTHEEVGYTGKELHNFACSYLENALGMDPEGMGSE